MTFDELQIRVVSGPNAVIAAAIRGHAPEAYNLAMNETLEEIQRHYSSALAHFTGDPGPFRAAEPQIARLLETQYREKPPDEKTPARSHDCWAPSPARCCSVGPATPPTC